MRKRQRGRKPGEQVGSQVARRGSGGGKVSKKGGGQHEEQGQRKHWKEKQREESQLEGGRTEKRKVGEAPVGYSTKLGVAAEQLSMVLRLEFH